MSESQTACTAYAYVGLWDMLHNFCFHVYAQKSLSHSLTLSLSHSLTLDMLNNFCFHVYAQKSLSLTLYHSHTLELVPS